MELWMVRFEEMDGGNEYHSEMFFTGTESEVKDKARKLLKTWWDDDMQCSDEARGIWSEGIGGRAVKLKDCTLITRDYQKTNMALQQVIYFMGGLN